MDTGHFTNVEIVYNTAQSSTKLVVVCTGQCLGC